MKKKKTQKQLPPSTQDSIYTYTFNNKVTLAANEQRKGDKENLTHDTSTNFDQKCIHEALKHIVCVNRGYNYQVWLCTFSKTLSNSTKLDQWYQENCPKILTNLLRKSKNLFSHTDSQHFDYHIRVSVSHFNFYHTWKIIKNILMDLY